MSKQNKILFGVLAVQVLIGIVTWSTVDVEPEKTVRHQLLDIKADDVTELRVVATEGNKEGTVADEVVIKKDGDHFVLASSGGFGADDEKVKEVLELIAAIEVSDPIATEPASYTKLNVADDGFDRKVTIVANGKTHHLVLGRGGRNATAVRLDKGPEVFEANNLTIWKVPGRATGYIDTSYVKVDADALKKVTVTNSKGSIVFEKSGDDWTIPALAVAPDTDSAAGEPLNLDKSGIASFVRQLANLNITKPMGKKVLPAYGLDQPAVTVRLEGGNDKETFDVSYQVGAKKESARYVKSRGDDFVVQVSSYPVDPAVEKVAGDFIKKPEAADSDGAAGHPAKPMPPGAMPMKR